MSQEKYPFNPRLGSERIVMQQEPKTGAIYFTTDTRKIYLDIDKDRTKVPMGGNVGLFYGKMRPAIVVDGQTEFDFRMSDIEGNENESSLLIPNVNDLILNNDGCFYKVLNSQGEGIETILLTEKLTIAGTGGGGGGSSGGGDVPGSQSSFNVGKFNVSDTAILKGSPCYVRFVVKSVNDIGEYVTGKVGSYKLYINKVETASGEIKGIPSGEVVDNLSNFSDEYINTINIAPFLPIGSTTPILEIYNNDGVKVTSRYLPTITTSSVELSWEYDNATLNKWIDGVSESMQLNWSVSGGNVEKVTYITIGNEGYPREIGRGDGTDFQYTLNFSDFNMLHGAHTVKMWVEVKIGNTTIPTDPIYKNIIVAQDDNDSTIISVCLFDKELKQYNTVAIPVYIYKKGNNGTATVRLIENGNEKDKWEDVPNLGADPNKSVWSYTPIVSGEGILLTVSSDSQEKTITVSVADIGIKLEEKTGYAFKFKANEFSSNTNVQNWKINNNPGLIFSDKFDWIHGGLQSENDPEYGHRQYFAIKAGSTMTINYPLWERNAPGTGKHFKFIFKTTNCRDYDAQALSCKTDRKIIHIDKMEEHFKLNTVETTLTYADTVSIENGALKLSNIKTDTLNINNPESRGKFENRYVEFEDGIYQCAFISMPTEEDPLAVYNTWYKVSIKDSFLGLVLKAQNGAIETFNESLITQYCEDTYIEFELEITKGTGDNKKYIKFWIDGVPCGYSEYTSDDFIFSNGEIVIGSPDCDVYVYLAKLYESDLTIEEHMNNFFVDAPNAEEMIRRFNRNNIMSDDYTGEIDMYKLAETNPECLVHHYEVPKMPTAKSTKIYPCSYKQYQGKKDVKYYAEGVMIKVQGTSSEKYVVSAANLDTDFNFTENGNTPSGIIKGETQQKQPDGWSMDDGTAIPINYACTKVNVASCENVNNMVNQEWYNMFQPYKSVLRCKNQKARDTMQFTSGVIFVTDHSTNTSDATGVNNNVFADTKLNGVSYANLPKENRYPKMYSLGQMGNSKDNIQVFHDTTNNLECCVEVADNQMPQQQMKNDQYKHEDIGESEKLFEFRYPKKSKNASSTMINAWNDFVRWMAHSNPQPKYNKFEEVTAEKFKDIAINKKTLQPVNVYVMNEEKTGHILVKEFDPNISTYYTETDNLYGYTEYVLDLPVEQRTFGKKTFEGFIAINQKKENGEYWQSGYTPMIRGCEVTKYAGTYTHDTYEYRMAKMLAECEEHLVMDSVLYHYLFIERHCMIDNVAKNTFWSTEDCQHWNLIKDYDNDTADGNDNQGKLTLTYGLEPTDKLNSNAYVFNANGSVWFNFCHGLDEALKYMYGKLENAYIQKDGKMINVWDYEAYLNLCKKIQSSIPERCWIEDYYRKYFRPNEVYNDKMYNSMLEGGQKKYQRKQYEIYQNLYMGTKYEGASLTNDRLLFRPSSSLSGGLLGVRIPVKVYSDCYVYSEVGQQIAKTRAKRNTIAYITCPTNNLSNATMYIHPGSNFTQLGSTEANGQLGIFSPDQMSFSGAKKLREIIYATSDSTSKNDGLTGGIDFSGTPLLETIHLCNLTKYSENMDLSDCSSLLYLSCLNSTFKDVEIANGAPVKTIELQNPTSLTLKNLTDLENLTINEYSRLKTLKLENVDSNNQNFSKNLLSNALIHAKPNDISTTIKYKLTDVDWKMTEASDVDDGNNIVIFDKMLDSKYTLPVFGDDLVTRLPYSVAFTGSVEIGSEAYSGNSPLEIYNKYITEDKFANIDLNFESNNSKLYNVIIYTGDGVPYWQKKAIAGTQINNEFLSSGPMGEFNLNGLHKSPTVESEYELLPKWIIKDDDGVEQTLEKESPTDIIITKNLYIYPQFKITPRSYEITIKMKHPVTGVVSVLAETQEYEYGTSLSEIIPNDLFPYIDSSSLSLYQAYDFKGYGLVEGSRVVVSSNYTVSGNQTLWAIFNLEDDIRTVTHPEWFEGSLATYEESLDKVYSNTQGIILTPKLAQLKGKITIPVEFEYRGIAYPVIGLSEFGGTSTDEASNHQITHVFMEKGKENKIYVIKNKAFLNSPSLEYFDFDNCAVRVFENAAFQYCKNLKTTSFGRQLLVVYNYAFNQSLTSNQTVTISIPSSVVHVEEHGFSNMGLKGGSTLEIGKSDNLSVLSLSRYISQQFRQNDSNKFKTINFYSANYDPGDSLVIEKLSDALSKDGTLSII